jgi:Spy/CpxP family protein refolding chaperone
MHHGMGGMCPTCGCGEGHHGMRGMMGMKWMMPWKLMMIADELGLSQDQRDKIHTTIIDMRKKKVQLKSQMAMDKIDLQGMMIMAMQTNEPMNMQVVEQKVRDIMNRKADMKLAMIQAIQDMKGTLTPEQRDKLKEMMMSWMKGGEESMEMEEDEESEE